MRFFLPNLYNTVLLIFDRKLQTHSFLILWHFIGIKKIAIWVLRLKYVIIKQMHKYIIRRYN